MFDFIKYIFAYFKNRRRKVPVQQINSQQDQFRFENVPPENKPVESFYDLHRIAGSSLDVGTLAKVILTPAGETVTMQQEQSVLLGCYHHVHSIDEIKTENWEQKGVGGVCPHCAKEQFPNLNKGQITLQQFEAL